MPTTRRTAAALLTAAPFIMRFPRLKADPSFNPDYATATQALKALAAGAISSEELVKHAYARIARYNPKINAFVTLREEQALAEAKKADRARMTKRVPGKLAGLPITIKDAFATAGIRTTAGSKRWENFVPTEDAVAVAKLRAAGAIILGKTSLPEYSGDIQAFNELVGTTNNPWNEKRTSGGSTGGGAASIAAGFSFLELGSDSGGSIRIPSHYCGVYGHKSTVHLVSRVGWMPPAPGEFKGPNDWSVAGPIARSAEDLQLMLEVAGGPTPEEAIAYQWKAPAPRKRLLKDFRVGFVADAPFCPVAPDMKEALAPVFKGLEGKTAKLVEGWPKGFDPVKNLEVFQFVTRVFGAPGGTWYAEWEKYYVERQKIRRIWREYFQEFDVFLTPVSIVPAILHDHTMPRDSRIVETYGGKRPYLDLSSWISPAGLSGCPASVAPVALTSRDRLPVGLQILGPFLEDLTPIQFAGLVGKIQRPPL
ncbi:amidase [Bryobacterales bacterium F-183]|nr:amidase [Bryobacterales bacterium F-183]